jgi:molybdopterin-synthase adenylyltransferase
MATDDLEVLLFPESILEGILKSAAAWGYLQLSVDRVERLSVVGAYAIHDGFLLHVRQGFLKDHYTSSYMRSAQGVWYRARPEVLGLWDQARRQQAVLAVQELSQRVQGWRDPGVGGLLRVVTITIQDDQPEVRGWLVDRNGALPAPAILIPEKTNFTDELLPAWPAADISSALATVVGTGSIGGYVCEALAAYGAHRLALIDPDRLLPHNLVRHVAGRKWVGRYKVEAIKEVLLERFPYLEVTPYPYSVIDEADMMRPLFASSSVVVCCADGVEARLVTSHLARRAGSVAVLACVLEDGVFGEVIRLRPNPAVGCLDCQRRQMREANELDPEPGIDLPYGTGIRHRAMVAVGGDLRLVGDLAAKVAVASILEECGYPDQRLAGDHVVLSLRPTPGWEAPFDFSRAGEMRWFPAREPVQGCPTCAPP